MSAVGHSSFGLAAGFGGFAFGLLDAFLAVAALGFLFRQPPFLDRRGPWRRRARWRARSARPRSGCAARRPNCCAARPRAPGRASGALAGAAFAAAGWARWRRLRHRAIAADAALAAFFDHHLLGPAMAEALAHGARLDARLERQGLGRDTQCLVARRFRINHSAVPILLRRANPHGLCRRIPGPPPAGGLVVIRHPVSDQGMAARQAVLLAGPASSAACITFDRPSAKSNCSEVSAVTTGSSRDSSLIPAFCLTMASNLRIPSAAPSEAWIRAWTWAWACR